MSHRVTIKELQERLDEMKTQRDEARKSCQILEKDIEKYRKDYGDGIKAIAEIDICHNLLNASLKRHQLSSAMFPPGKVWDSGVGLISERVLLHDRLARFLINASICEGRLAQADAIRTFNPYAEAQKCQEPLQRF